MRILIVEDDIQIAEMLAEALSDLLFAVDIVHDGEAAYHHLQTLEYDLMILDLTLPKLDGISLCRQMRENGYSIPILMLTARDTISDKVVGLESGADDYLVKPFDMAEFIARVRALLRRGSAAASAELSWGQLHINPSSFEVRYNQDILQLTPKEYSLLELLVSNGRRVLSRGQIIERLWSLEDPPSEEAVKAHIKSLRMKLRSVEAPDDFIETVHGLGYRLKQV